MSTPVSKDSVYEQLYLRERHMRKVAEMRLKYLSEEIARLIKEIHSLRAILRRAIVKGKEQHNE